MLSSVPPLLILVPWFPNLEIFAMISSCQNLVFFQFFALAFLSCAATASDCNRTCGATTVSFPFGFSSSCRFQLNCTAAGEMQLGEHRVRNITPEAIILEVTPACNQPIADAAGLFGAHYALSSSNALFLRNCSRSASGAAACSISTEMIAARLNVTDCGRQGGNISCFSSAQMDGPLTLDEVKKATAGCEFLFAVVRYGDDVFDQPSLVFGAAEIEWWLEGECRCAANANCEPVRVPAGAAMNKTRFRCRCREGFVGDGFADGNGCVREKCSASSSVSGCRGRSNTGILVGGAIGGASLLLGLAFLCYRIRRRRSAFCKGEEITQRLLSQTPSTIVIYSHKDVERATSNFSDASKLGSGAYATVYVGKLHNTGLVAVKRLKHPDIDNVERVINEIKLISSVSHPNLVHLLGCCLGPSEHILVYEFVPNGTLSQHLHRERGDGLQWPARVSIAAEIARAVAHLHTAVQPPIYHRDVKSSNILLDYNFSPKLADFGLSRRGMEEESSHISTAPQGTPGYVDPQYHQNFHLSDKSDVYSFGVVLAEIVTAMKVVDFRRAPAEVNLASLAVEAIGRGTAEDIVDPLIKESWDGRTRASVWKVAELAFRCLAFDREARPAMVEVAEELERIRKEGCGIAQGGGLEEQEGRLRILLGRSMSVKAASPVSVECQWASDHSRSSNGSFSC